MTVIVVGDAALDVVARHHSPIAHAGDSRADIALAVGGAGANTAAWLASFGVDTVLVGRVGDDMAGRQVRSELSSAGVRCALATDRTAPTCCVVVLVDGDGQRSMLADRGANARLEGSDLTVNLLETASHLHLSGYVLLDPASRNAGLEMLAAARGAGLTTSVDPQAALHIVTQGAETFLAMVAGVDLLLPNAEELAALTGSRDPSAAAALLDHVGAVAVTTGPDGASWVDRVGRWDVPAAPATCVDSTGAGDAFDAGLLAAWLRGQPPLEVLRAGVAAGSKAVSRVGAQPS
ncbi:carbohydrate kinase family protein [Kutzneria kofuensis]|uniref:Sugar/nucleoside kinase (Ribokinase family) n=1 Tax=Kutzneria kofuensis TaxID=103725 RepID=A0A7W9NJD5_9PSEU|nr:sugar kinase [Kutzneria kofuensis]MBB5894534.1 sugar/nucleoside kinase (ribokinase family) [Kutzneria kofuensis]